jgi:hypothetical protein
VGMLHARPATKLAAVGEVDGWHLIMDGGKAESVCRADMQGQG